ncbi:MAG: hypothetical protein HY658_06710 [Actinobacteria bacterium]|nr:hypothetical protein [Actinomycetota bacterium]
MSERVRVGAAVGLALGLAVALSLSGTRLGASQGARVVAQAVPAGSVPAEDPYDPFWEEIVPVEVPLSAQQVTPPKGGRRWTLQARAVHDDRNVYIAVEWDDPAPDRSVGAVQDFTDAVAVQFPGDGSLRIPALCMGDPQATVNIWQWRAASQLLVRRGPQGIEDRYPGASVDLYPFREEEVFYPGRYVGNPLSEVDRTSAVDNLVAGGFGTLTPDPEPIVSGIGAWRAGRWRVVFSRPLSVGREGNPEFGVPDLTDMAFAVWDGGVHERDGVKSVSSFVTLQLSLQDMPRGSSFPHWPAPFVVFFVLWLAAAWLMIPRTRRDR